MNPLLAAKIDIVISLNDDNVHKVLLKASVGMEQLLLCMMIRRKKTLQVSDTVFLNASDTISLKASDTVLLSL